MTGCWLKNDYNELKIATVMAIIDLLPDPASSTINGRCNQSLNVELP